MDEITYARLHGVVRGLLGLDLTQYKPQQMQRRIGNFIDTQAGGDVEAFVRRLRTDPPFLAAFRDMVTINVSEFFRDAAQFRVLEEQVLPEIVERRPHPSIWSAACSAGQEPYTVAMLLDELGAARRTRILATDFDETVLGRARAGGPYVADDLRQMTAERRERYIRPRDAHTFMVAPELRRLVTFRRHNLLEDDYGRGYDLVICRNVIIYFSAEAKRAVIDRFHAALAPDGVLFIGGTEALLGGDADGFAPLGGNFYRRLPERARRAA